MFSSLEKKINGGSVWRLQNDCALEAGMYVLKWLVCEIEYRAQK
jgi:hypothetical protein